MGFFKPSDEATSDRSIARLQSLIWLLIYGGLLSVLLGLFVGRSDGALGWTLIGAGAAIALVGAVLIWVRSRLKTGR